MKRWKRVLLFLLCLMMLQAPILSDYTGITATTVQAATKNGLVKKGKNYYYYKKGKMVKNAWKTVKTTVNGKTVKYRYYFGKNGKAYRATTSYNCTYNVVIKKVNGKKYGFDTKGRLAAGVYADEEKTAENLYYFNAKGVYNAKKTKALNAVAKEGGDLAALVALLGEPESRTEADSCLIAGYTDITLTYEHFSILALRAPESTEETIYAIYTE